MLSNNKQVEQIIKGIHGIIAKNDKEIKELNLLIEAYTSDDIYDSRTLLPVEVTYDEYNDFNIEVDNLYNENEEYECEFNLLNDEPMSSHYFLAEACTYATNALQKFKDKDYKGALIHLNKAIELSPNESLYYRYRSWVKKKLKDLEGALADKDEDIKLDSLCSSSYIGRAYIKQMMNNYSGAIYDYDSAVRIEPSNIYYYQYRAEAKEKSDDIAGAIIDYNKIIELDIINKTAYYFRGKLKKKIGDKSYYDDWKKAVEYGSILLK